MTRNTDNYFDTRYYVLAHCRTASYKNVPNWLWIRTRDMIKENTQEIFDSASMGIHDQMEEDGHD